MLLRLVSTLLGVVVLTVLIGYLPNTEAASTQRPYEFGFSIEKQQHRHEKKDERGIVMGEFGFITADGIYHVTVYATDEEGKFRILAMRSYPYEENPKTIEMVVRPKAKPTTPKAIAPPSPGTTTERAKPKPFEKHNFSVQGCSGCFIKNNAPTTTKKPEDKKYDISLLSKPLAPEGTPVIDSAPPGTTLNVGKAKTSTTGAYAPQAPGKTGTNAVPKAPSNQPSVGVKGSTSNISTPNTQITVPAINAGNTGGASTGIGGASGGSSGFGGTNNFDGNSGSGAAKGAVGSKAGSVAGSGRGAPGSKAGNAEGFAGGSPGNQAGNAAGFVGGSPGSKAAGFGGGSAGGKTGNAAGFVSGLAGSKSAVGEAGDLYRFKYLLDYNGHRETGSHNGNKEGSFYAIGDDNVERTIEYIANEFGYQPRVRFRKLDAPVLANENTLKDYEFVWFKKA
ncbi:PREDICTED: protein lethal(3)malignant blood neoplasm 1 [Bactrocera latifrons]|uniref:protein lethal(3)malignant blood neoplasm 1 n=1 Tax=Bactrocera latifrons TaxID=174628 RepID=UPI0008DCF134|nr:PREDICTED: protein lethal(3)malignant blood neoplasm 1 [Bactrocera latifrons]